MRQLATILLIVFATNIYSQVDNVENVNMVNEHLFLDIYSNYWLDAPKGMEIKPNSISSGLTWMLVILGRESCVSANLGYGFSALSVKNNGVLGKDAKGNSIFNTEILDTVNYKINKFTTVYADIPFELRIRTRPGIKNRNFNISLGFKFGVLLQSYVKYFGDDYRFSISDEVKYKRYKLDNLMPYQYGVYARIGYGKFYFFGYYSLSGLFNEKKGPDLTPVSFGLSFALYRSKTFEKNE